MIKKLSVTAVLFSLISCGANMSETGNNGEPEGSHASAEWQIWAYTTAAPDFIGDFATVIGQTDLCLEREQMDGGVKPL